MKACELKVIGKSIQITYDNAGNKYDLTVDLSGLGLTAGNNVTVTLTVKKWVELSGQQRGLPTIVGMRWREAGFGGAALSKRTLNTMLHEPEHAMGLAPSTKVDGTANTPHYYTSPGQGPHCHNLSDGCVMMHSNSESIVTCPICSDVLRARNLSALPIQGTAPIP